MHKSPLIIMTATIAAILATSAFAFALPNQAFAQVLRGKQTLPPEINSAIGKILAGEEAQVGKVLKNFPGGDVVLDIQHKPRGVPFELDVDAHTHQPREP